mmetsp:Transcript_108068/g.161665  ORF Transcript_108068/g.161665 Transcript_108068/m.161665 type:complete len:355 (-) Transcript_108068:891-1955(-)
MSRLLEASPLQHLALDLAVDCAEEVDVGANRAGPVFDEQRKHARLCDIFLLDDREHGVRCVPRPDLVDDGDKAARELVVAGDEQQVLRVTLRQRVHVEHLLEEGLGEVFAEPHQHRLAVLDEVRALGFETLRRQAHRRGQRDLTRAVGVARVRRHVVQPEEARVDKGRRLAGTQRQQALAEVGSLVRLDDGGIECERLVLQQPEGVEREELEGLGEDELPRRRVRGAELAVHVQDLDARRDELVACGVEGLLNRLRHRALRGEVDHRVEVGAAEDGAYVVGDEDADGVDADPARSIRRRVQHRALHRRRRPVRAHVALELQLDAEGLVGVDCRELDVALERLVERPKVLLHREP